MINHDPEAQPTPGPNSGYVLASTGRWTEAGLRRLEGIDPKDVTFYKGAIGYSVIWNRKTIGRINVYANHKQCTARIDGHEYWVAPNPVMNKWHYNPGTAVANVREAKAMIKAAIEGAMELLNGPGGEIEATASAPMKP